MRAIFYKTLPIGRTDKMLDTLFSLLGEAYVHFTCDIEALKNALLKYRLEMPMVVIQVSSMKDVSEIKGLSDLIDGLFLIVIADSDNKGLLVGCRQLYPRLITHSEDIHVIAAVIERRLAMACKSESI
jgi:hypothetical protein